MSRVRRLWPVLAAGLAFVVWITYLAVLAFSTRHAIILSRPQLIAADTIVIADIQEPSEEVEIVRVIRGDPNLKPKNILIVENLPGLIDGGLSWDGPGKYILPLQRLDNGHYKVAPTGISPGYHPPGVGKDQQQNQGPPRIYPANPETIAQLPEK